MARVAVRSQKEIARRVRSARRQVNNALRLVMEVKANLHGASIELGRIGSKV